MVKKKRQADAYASDSGSTSDSDGKSMNNCGLGAGSECPHVKRSVDTAKLRKVIKSVGITLEKCTECAKMIESTKPATLDDDEEGSEYDKTLWLCLMCGSQLCGRSKNEHALKHYKTPRSDSHSLAVNTTTFDIWCYQCDNEVNCGTNKKLKECIDMLKKEAEKPTSPVQSLGVAKSNTNEVNQSILNTLQETISVTMLVNQQVNEQISKSNGYMTIPGTAKRVQPLLNLPRVRGLSNLGNTCFFNAVTQCLAQTPYLLPVLKECAAAGEEFELPGGVLNMKDDESIDLPPIKGELCSWGILTAALAETLEELQISGGVHNPRKLFHQLTSKWPQFSGGDQHDSHELLRHLLESVRSEDLRRYQKVILHSLGYNKEEISAVPDVMKMKCKFYGQQASDRILRPEQVFRGFLVSTLTCQDCYHTSSRHEHFLDLSLPVSVEKPQPPMRRRTSPDPPVESTSVGPSKHQLKKEKERERKLKRSQKHHSKKVSLAGPSGDTEADNELGAAVAPLLQTSESEEQSDADVEDNLTEDTPTYGNLNNNMPGLYDPNGNTTVADSTIDPEKSDSTPENPNKYLNDDETDSGIATSPSNPTANAIDGGIQSNVIVEMGLSNDRKLNLVKELALTNGSVDKEMSATDDFAKLNLKDESVRKQKKQRNRTYSHTDWSTTIAPRYQSEDGECSIQSCLNNFTAIELMTGNNKVGCDACTERLNGKDGKTINTNATKQFLISSPPAVLILHLKRFQVGQRFMFRKITKHVTFPFILDIAPFCGSKVKNLPNIDRKQKKLLYSLYGIVEHSGGMHGGHYTAYVKVRPKLKPDDPRWKFIPQGSKAELEQTDEQRARLEEALEKARAKEMRMRQEDSDDTSSSETSSEEMEKGAVGGSEEPPIPSPPEGKWYYVSDSSVQEATEESVLNAQAYLLFYERIY